jgi:regulator of replication initiation timing
MGENRPLSLTTCLGKIGAAGGKLARLSLVQRLVRSIPGLPTAALAGVVIMFFAWSCERQARQRDMAAAKQVKKQAAEDISRLQQQVAGALRDAKQSAQAVRELEDERQQLAREGEGLRQSLESLRQQELARTNEVATLPTSEVVSRVASRLQEQVSGVRGQVSGQQEEQVSGVRGQGSGQQEEQVSGVRGQGSGQSALNPLTRPALAEESASAGHPLPQGGEGRHNLGGEGNNPQGQNKPQGQGQNNPQGESEKYPAAVRGQKQLAPGTGPLAPNASPATSPALVLSDQGVRKVETALIELDSCRQQTQVMGQQVSNCEQQAKVSSAIQEQQSGTITKLEAALADKDQILARREEAHRAELKAARGTWRARFFRAVEYFAGGFIAGVLVR